MGGNSKLDFVNKIRNIIDRVGIALPLPNVNPNVLTALSIITSLLFLIFLKYQYAALIFLALTLMFDWFDGIVARKFGRVSDEGYLADLAGDRFSEGIIFSAFFFPWFYFFCMNCLLAIMAVRRNRHIILPLRHCFLVFYAFMLLHGQF